jgi:hypothetical protein
MRDRLRFDRNELSGAFGDLGTSFPLLVGIILASGLDVTGALVAFGAMLIFSGLTYGLPMPVQPLKAMAVIVITQRLSAGVLLGGGLAIGLAMLALTATGLIDRLADFVPKVVVRGIQLGLGLQLASLALKDYVTADGGLGYVLAGAAFIATISLIGNRRFPPAPLVILMGVTYAVVFKVQPQALFAGLGLALPTLRAPSWSDVATGALVLALPQLPLSLGNSILGTRQAVADLFPGREVTARKIGWTYSLMNLVNPFVGGVPTCHGAGGVAGHHAFGARTGGSVVIAGLFYAGLGLFASGAFGAVIALFPRPMLGVILLFEALALIRLVGDLAAQPQAFGLALLIGLLAFGLPYGYVVALVCGTILAYVFRNRQEGLGSR